MMPMESREPPRMILQALKASSQGLTISEITDKTGLSRATVSKYMLFLQHMGSHGFVELRNVGNAKLFSINDSANGEIDRWIKGADR